VYSAAQNPFAVNTQARFGMVMPFSGDVADSGGTRIQLRDAAAAILDTVCASMMAVFAPGNLQDGSPAAAALWLWPALPEVPAGEGTLTHYPPRC
jgi:hypothetical protein